MIGSRDLCSEVNKKQSEPQRSVKSGFDSPALSDKTSRLISYFSELQVDRRSNYTTDAGQNRFITAEP